MHNVIEKIRTFVQDEEGLTAVEYSIVGGLITAGLVTMFTSIGTDAAAKLQALCTNMTGAAC